MLVSAMYLIVYIVPAGSSRSVRPKEPLPLAGRPNEPVPPRTKSPQMLVGRRAGEPNGEVEEEIRLIHGGAAECDRAGEVQE